jgi:hypothetical protein
VKTNAVIVNQGDKIRLSKIDPDDAGGASKKKACTVFVDLRGEVSLLQEKLFAEHERSLLIQSGRERNPVCPRSFAKKRDQR